MNLAEQEVLSRTQAELAEVLKSRDAGGVPCQRVYKLAKAKLKGVRGDIEALKRPGRYLKQVLSDCIGIRARRAIVRGAHPSKTAKGEAASVVMALTMKKLKDGQPPLNY